MYSSSGPQALPHPTLSVIMEGRKEGRREGVEVKVEGSVRSAAKGPGTNNLDEGEPDGGGMFGARRPR